MKVLMNFCGGVGNTKDFVRDFLLRRTAKMLMHEAALTSTPTDFKELPGFNFNEITDRIRYKVEYEAYGRSQTSFIIPQSSS